MKCIITAIHGTLTNSPHDKPTPRQTNLQKAHPRRTTPRQTYPTTNQPQTNPTQTNATQTNHPKTNPTQTNPAHDKPTPDKPNPDKPPQKNPPQTKHPPAIFVEIIAQKDAFLRPIPPLLMNFFSFFLFIFSLTP